jgi:hypothetical protein
MSLSSPLERLARQTAEAYGYSVLEDDGLLRQQLQSSSEFLLDDEEVQRLRELTQRILDDVWQSGK